MESDLESSNRSQEIIIDAKFKRSRNLRQQTTGLEIVNSNQLSDLTNNIRTNFAPATPTEQLPIYKLTVPLEESEEVK